MKRKEWNSIKIAIIAGVILILLANGAIAETNRQKVVKEACYALDGGQDYTCGDMTKIGNWNYLNSDVLAYEYLRDNFYNQFSSNYWYWNDIKKQWEGEFGDPSKYGYKDNIGRGGQCKYAANLIVYRAGQKGQPGSDKFVHYQGMIDTISTRTIGYTKPGDVILNTLRIYKKPIYNKDGVIIRYQDQYYLYTVISINSGNSLLGTVTSIQAVDNSGNEITISNTDTDTVKYLPDYKISRYSRSIKFAQPGDVIYQADEMLESFDHTAIVVKINTGESNDGTVTSLDVVDSNFVTGAGNEVIGYHKIEKAALQKYYVYTGVSYYNEIWNLENPLLFHYLNWEDPNDPYQDRIYEIGFSSDGNTMYKHWIMHEQALKDQWYYPPEKIYDVSINPADSLWKTMISGENIVFKDGTLIENNAGVIFEIKNGEKHGFASMESYLSHGYTLDTPRIKVTDIEANAVPTGLAIDYRLLTKEAGLDPVYIIQGNEKKHVLDTDTAKMWNIDLAKTEIVSKDELDKYADMGELIPDRYGNFVGKSTDLDKKDKPKEGADIYFISIDENGNTVKRYINNATIMTYLGGIIADVYWLDAKIFNSIPTGVEYAKPSEPKPVKSMPIDDPKSCKECHTEPIGPISDLASITVLPKEATIQIAETEIFMAIPQDQYGNLIATDISWSVENETVGSIDAAGFFIAAANGSTKVFASSGSISGNATINVTLPLLPLNAKYVTLQNQTWVWAPVIQTWAYGTLYPIYAFPNDGSFLMDTPLGSESYIEKKFYVPLDAANLSTRIWGAKNMDGTSWCGEPVITTISLTDSGNSLYELDKFTPVQTDNGIGDSIGPRNYSITPYTGQTVKIRIDQTSGYGHCTYGFYKDIGIQTN